MRRVPAWLTAAMLAMGAAPGAAEAARDCAVAGLEGPGARLWREGDWQPLARGPLPRGAAIVATGPESRVEIRCDDGVVVTIGHDTEINLATLLPERPAEEASVALQLLRGVAGVAAPLGDWLRFDLRAPLAIASVRSTEWLAVHTPGEGTAVFVREGQVSVRPLGPGNPVALSAGEGVDVPPDGPPGPVKTWGRGRIERLGARLGFGWR